MNDNEQAGQCGFATRHENWAETSATSTVARTTMEAVANYRLLRAATRAEATPAARLLLVHLIGYLGRDDPRAPASRFVVFPGNARLADELRCSVRSVQRQADELEAAGLVRRCYNGMNRRTGFDLAPFAVQHKEIVAEICAIHTERRERREMAQLELGLAAPRIERPEHASYTSSRDDAGVALNSPTGSSTVIAGAIVSSLMAIPTSMLPGVAPGTFVGGDRTEDERMSAAAHASQALSRDGRVASLSWASAVSCIGYDAAVGLYIAASRDPARRASVERYFSWLLKACIDGTSDAVEKAASRTIGAARQADDLESRPRDAKGTTGRARATGSHATGGQEPPADIRPAEWGERPAAPSPGRSSGTVPAQDQESMLSATVRSTIGERLYDTWLSDSRFEIEDERVVVKSPRAFAARWLTDHLANELEAAIAPIAPGRVVRVEHCKWRGTDDAAA